MEFKQAKDITNELMIGSNIPEDLCCVICLGIVKVPIRDNCPSASHLFCLQCIFKWLYLRKICPISKYSLDEGNLTYDDVAAGKLSQLDVKCRYWQNGCKWVGRLKEFASHVEICPSGWRIMKSPIISLPNSGGSEIESMLDEYQIQQWTFELAAIIMDFTKVTKSGSNAYHYRSLASLQLVYRKSSDPYGTYIYSERLGGIPTHHPENVNKREVFQLAPNDKLTKAIFYDGSDFFPYVGFATMLNPTPSFFGFYEYANHSQTIELGPKAQIIGICGRMGWAVDAFGFVYLETNS